MPCDSPSPRFVQRLASRAVLALAAGLLLGVSSESQAQSQSSEANQSSPLWERLNQRSPWIFLGDSNTYSGGYVAVLEAWLDGTQHPKLLNLGVSSETASGLSEVDHPFKRPCVHERLEKVLSMTQPGVVFVCYGMNDGIYQPHSAKNLEAYRDGMLRLAEAVHKSGAELICLTPPIFEPGPVLKRGKLGPTDQGRYAYFAPAADYDRVLEKQAEWCLRNEMLATRVIDLHSMLHREKELLVAQTPDFQFSKDGVHFGPVAHALVAEGILKGIGAPDDLLSRYPSDESIALAQKKHQMLRDAYLAATGKNRPRLPAGMPIWLAEKRVADLDR